MESVGAIKIAGKKILLIYCGGTIGMTKVGDCYRPSVEFAVWLKAQLRQRQTDNVDVVSLHPLIDSASATPSDWRIIIKTIQAQQNNYSAFVVLHGTDTLSYTAAALAFAFATLNKAIIITGAQRTYQQDNSDALANIMGALAFARHKHCQFTAVYFAGLLLPALFARKVHTQADSAFASPNAPLLGQRQHGDYMLSAQARAFFVPDLSFNLDSDWCKQSIALYHLSPNIHLPSLEAVFTDANVQGIVLLSYGLGNIADNPTLYRVIGDAKARGVLIVNCTQCPAGQTHHNHYASGAGSLKIIEAGVLGYEAIFVLLHFAAANQTKEQALQNYIDQYAAGSCANSKNKLQSDTPKQSAK